MQKTRLQRLKETLRKVSALAMVFGLLLTSYGVNLSFSQTKAQTNSGLVTELQLNNMSLEDFNKPPYHSVTSVYATPDQVVRLYQYYDNTSSEVKNNVDLVMKTPMSGNSKAQLRLGSVDPINDNVSVSYSNNNGSSYDYTPTGDYDGNVTNIKWSIKTLDANSVNNSVQAQFNMPDVAVDTAENYSASGSLNYNGEVIESNSVSIKNSRRPELNKLDAGEVERTLQGTNQIHANPTPWTDVTPVEIGEEIGLLVNMRNIIPRTEVRNLKFRLEFPTDYGTTQVVKVYITGDNMDTLVDQTTFTLPSAGRIRYLTNTELTGRYSCKMSIKDQFQYKLCGDEIATTGYTWVDGPLQYGTDGMLRLTVEALVEGQPVATPSPTPSTTASPAPTESPTPVPTQTPSPSPTSTPTQTPVATPTLSPTPSPTVSPTPNISIEKHVDGDARLDGDKIGLQYRIKVKNNSDQKIDNVEIRDLLPDSFTYDKNTVDGDLSSREPDEQDVDGIDNNRRLVWKNVSINANSEINFGYRVTGTRQSDQSYQYCNNAEAIKDNIDVKASACAIVKNTTVSEVKGTSTVKELPSTGSNPMILVGLMMLVASGVGFKMSKYQG